MDSLALVCVLMLIYFGLTFFSPRVLTSRRLLIAHPASLIALWLTALGIASASLLGALGILISRALRHHVTHLEGHDIATPVIDSVLGWLAIAVLGILTFRLGVAAQEARANYREVGAILAPVIAGARSELIGTQRVWVVDTELDLIAALPQARRVVLTQPVFSRLSDAQLRAALEHEASHLRHHHERILVIASLAEAVAPAFLAGKKMAQSCRIATELIADDDAARACGSEMTARALEVAYPNEPSVTDRVRRLRGRKR